MARRVYGVIFYHVAEYADYANKLTVKWRGKRVQRELWFSDGGEVKYGTDKYKSRKEAYQAYRCALGAALLGGWHVLNLYPKQLVWVRDTDEKKK